MQPENSSNSTTNTILILLLVVIVGFAVWFVMDRKAATDDSNDEAGLQINLTGGSDDEGSAN